MSSYTGRPAIIKQANILGINALPGSDVQKCEKLAAQMQMARTY
jgi:hypothetical protein